MAAVRSCGLALWNSAQALGCGLLRLAVIGLAAGVAVYIGLTALIAWPDAIYRHDRGAGPVTFHATSPLPAAAESLAEELALGLAASPLGPLSQEIDIWLVEEGWQAAVFFAPSPGAVGLTYPNASHNNVFLRHADLHHGRLIAHGRPVAPPLTLGYFLLHEVAHLQVAKHPDATAAHDMPRWIHEGLADLVALGPAPPVMMALVEAGGKLPAARWGTYARERACVTRALKGMDLTSLFALTSALPPGGGCPAEVGFAIAPAGGQT